MKCVEASIKILMMWKIHLAVIKEQWNNRSQGRRESPVVKPRWMSLEGSQVTLT
jgi:hypothetical protein